MCISIQGKLEKVVIIIKDRQEVALERFIISVENMIQVEGFNKDTPFVDSKIALTANDRNPLE